MIQGDIIIYIQIIRKVEAYIVVIFFFSTHVVTALILNCFHVYPPSSLISSLFPDGVNAQLVTFSTSGELAKITLEIMCKKIKKEQKKKRKRRYVYKRKIFYTYVCI